MSDIDKPAVTTSLGQLKWHFDRVQKSEARAEPKRDALTLSTHIRIEEIHQKAQQVTKHSYEHLKKHRHNWVERQYVQLLKSTGNTRDFHPSWSSHDKSAHLRRAAEHLVTQRHYKRLRTIQKAMVRAIKTEATQTIGLARHRRDNKRQDQGR